MITLFLFALRDMKWRPIDAVWVAIAIRIARIALLWEPRK